MELVKNNSALLIVDMQNSFLEPDGAMNKLGFDCEKLRSAIPGTQRLIAAARSQSIPVIYTQYVFQPGFIDGGWLVNDIMPSLKDVNLCVKNTWDAEIIEIIQPKFGETIVQKNRPSAFFSTQLESILNSMEIENLVVCGVTANMCVETTVRDSCQRDIRTFVVSDAIAEVDDDRMKLAIMTMEYFFARVMSVNEVIDSWGADLKNAVQ